MIHILGKSFAAFSLVMLLAVSIACGGGGRSAPSPSQSTSNGGNSQVSQDTGWDTAEIDGRVMAQKFVRENLRFPDDASFPWATTLIEFGDPERKDVWANGKVKAKNALGAELTYNFRIRMARAGKTWHPYYLVLDGETLIDRREDPTVMEILEIEPVAIEVAETEPTGKSDSGTKSVESEVSSTEVTSPDRMPSEPIEPDLSSAPTIEEATSGTFNRQPKVLTGIIEFETETERIWQSLDGKFSTTATLIKFDRDKDKVQLRKSDGSEIAVPIKTLSLDDRNYIRGQAREAE